MLVDIILFQYDNSLPLTKIKFPFHIYPKVLLDEFHTLTLAIQCISSPKFTRVSLICFLGHTVYSHTVSNTQIQAFHNFVLVLNIVQYFTIKLWGIRLLQIYIVFPTRTTLLKGTWSTFYKHVVDFVQAYEYCVFAQQQWTNCQIGTSFNGWFGWLES